MTAPTARFTLSDDVFVEAGMRTHAAGVAAARKRYVLYGALLGALFALQLVLGRAPGAPLPWLTGAMGLAFLALAGVHPALVRRRIRALTAGRTDLGAPVTVRALPEALEVDVARVADTRYRLAALHGVEPEPAGVLVRVQPLDGLWVPDAAFATPADRDAFERVVLAGAPLPDPAL